MLQILRNAWKVQDLRKKILFTLMIIFLFRIGSAIPVPFLDASSLAEMFSGTDGTLVSYINVLTGDAFQKATLFAMSITPYINASIIIQLLCVAITPLGKLAKEGEEGRKKINAITRYTSIGLAFVQALAYYLTLKNNNVVQTISDSPTTLEKWFIAAVIIITFTAGSAIIVWLGERVNDNGIGNGISIILFAGIVSRVPSMLTALYSYFTASSNNFGGQVVVILLFLLIIAAVPYIVLINEGERRIPVQYAKRVVGRKQYGGQNSNIPLKVTMSGVMPIIFASALLSVPNTIIQIAGMTQEKNGGWFTFLNFFNTSSIGYAVLYLLLIIGFNYFYVEITYNPLEISNNLRKNNGSIPGIRPGKPTSDFIQKVLGKIVLIGAIALAVVAITPIIISIVSSGAYNIGLGGTSLLIVVGVAIETVRSLESQMMMRHYKGFLE